MRAIFDLLILLVNVYTYDTFNTELLPSQKMMPFVVEGLFHFQKIIMQTLNIVGIEEANKYK